MNLTTRRMSEDELVDWAAAVGRQVWGFHVSDKFGDSGLTGILTVEQQGGAARVVDFVLSCRVMGRKVEESMLHVAVEWARSVDSREVRLEYVPSAKNRPCLDFLIRSKLVREDENLFVWDAACAYPLHPAVRLVCRGFQPTTPRSSIE
jgi:FkbH-like protein